jgi:hypothetical protein
MLSGSWTWPYLILIHPLWAGHHAPHFIPQESESQRETVPDL